MDITNIMFYIACKYSNTLSLKVAIVCVHITLSHYHHYKDLSEAIEHIKCMSNIKSILAIIFYAVYSGLCVFSLPILL